MPKFPDTVIFRFFNFGKWGKILQMRVFARKINEGDSITMFLHIPFGSPFWAEFSGISNSESDFSCIYAFLPLDGRSIAQKYEGHHYKTHFWPSSRSWSIYVPFIPKNGNFQRFFFFQNYEIFSESCYIRPSNKFAKLIN